MGGGGRTVADSSRRTEVLDSALKTFARLGYHRTSMAELAREAHISRPGLYFLFDSKEDLFRAAVTRALFDDLDAVERELGRDDRTLRERLLVSFDQWAGRYVGPIAGDISQVVADNPDLLGPITRAAPRRFQKLITGAIAAECDSAAAALLAQTLISTSIGIKTQVRDRKAYLKRLGIALDLLLP